jgi:hypothetical protein
VSQSLPTLCALASRSLAELSPGLLLSRTDQVVGLNWDLRGIRLDAGGTGGDADLLEFIRECAATCAATWRETVETARTFDLAAAQARFNALSASKKLKLVTGVIGAFEAAEGPPTTSKVRRGG